VVVYFDISALLLGLAWLITLWGHDPNGPAAAWDAIMVAASPAGHRAGVHQLRRAATAFRHATGLLAWSRRNPPLAGYCSAWVPRRSCIRRSSCCRCCCLHPGRPVDAGCGRSSRRGGRGCGEPADQLLYHAGWWEFFRLNVQRGMDPDSVYTT